MITDNRWQKIRAKRSERFRARRKHNGKLAIYTVKPPFGGHPRDKEKCPLNGGVPLLEVTSTKIIYRNI